MGMHVNAAAHRLTFAPHLPTAWQHAELEHVRFGEHEVSARVTRDELAVTHLAGETPLAITLRTHGRPDAVFTVPPGRSCRVGLLAIALGLVDPCERLSASDSALPDYSSS